MACGGKDLGYWFFLLLFTCIMLVVFSLSTIHCSSLSPLAYTSYEVIIPRRLAAQMGKTKKDEMSYIIKAAGRDYIIRLKPKKNFLAKNLPIFTYNSKGERVESHPYIPVECYHQGYVEGIVDSLAVLRTCFGLTGFLKIGAKTYGIEPLQNSSAFQHLLYLSEESEPTFSSYRMGVGRTNHQAEKLVTRQIRTHKNLQDEVFPKYIELYVVVDKYMFAQEANNISRVETIVLDVVNIVDTTFSALSTHVVLVGLEIWTERNLINISAGIKHVLQNFNEWRIVNKRSVYDTAFLFLHQSFGEVLGMSYKSAICQPSLSAGLQVYLKNEIIRFVKGFSHELGHHLGMEHDGSNCFCSKNILCIMHGHHGTANLFSNCSILNFKQLHERGLLDCLLNVPRIRSNFGYCGNGILNAGEQCDCGGTCKEDSCCTSSCVFKGKSVCQVGKCCQQCKYLPKGTICRLKVGKCDLPEYCSGRSARCPKDLYMQDGTLCDVRSYCYEKRCWNHDFLCKRIFSEEAINAPEKCYHFLNAFGNKSGNCGTDSTGKRFLKCQPKDSVCGRVQCTDVGSARGLEGKGVQRHVVQKTPCWSIAQPGEIHHDDIGAVPNGIACAPHKICINHSCVPIATLNLSCNSGSMCQNRGVCNNLQKCHCNNGWAPPDCKRWGAGGSIDGGFPLMSRSTKMIKRILGTVIPLSLVGIAAIIEIVPKVGGFLASVIRWWRQRFRLKTLKVFKEKAQIITEESPNPSEG